MIVGPNADNFSLPKGKDLPIAAKGRANLHVDFLGNNLKPGNAYLILVGRKKDSMVADTIVFCMNASIDELTAKVFNFHYLSELSKCLRIYLPLFYKLKF